MDTQSTLCIWAIMSQYVVIDALKSTCMTPMHGDVLNAWRNFKDGS